MVVATAGIDPDLPVAVEKQVRFDLLYDFVCDILLVLHHCGGD